MEALLQLKGIDKAFPGVKALSGAALNVYPGRVMALVCLLYTSPSPRDRG